MVMPLMIKRSTKTILPKLSKSEFLPVNSSLALTTRIKRSKAKKEGRFKIKASPILVCFFHRFSTG